MRGAGRALLSPLPDAREDSPLSIPVRAPRRLRTLPSSRSETRPLEVRSSRHDQSSASSGRRACGRGKLSLRQLSIPVTRRTPPSLPCPASSSSRIYAEVTSDGLLIRPDQRLGRDV